MSNLSMPIVQIENSQFFMSSLDVANFYGKSHKNVIRDIEKIINSSEEDGSNKANIEPSSDTNLLFKESTYISKQNKVQPCYNITMNGLVMLANSYNSSKSLELINSIFEARLNSKINQTKIETLAQITKPERLSFITQVVQELNAGKKSSEIADELATSRSRIYRVKKRYNFLLNLETIYTPKNKKTLAQPIQLSLLGE